MRGTGAGPVPAGDDYAGSPDGRLLRKDEGAAAVHLRIPQRPNPEALLGQPQRPEGRYRLPRSLPTPMLVNEL